MEPPFYHDRFVCAQKISFLTPRALNSVVGGWLLVLKGRSWLLKSTAKKRPRVESRYARFLRTDATSPFSMQISSGFKFRARDVAVLVSAPHTSSNSVTSIEYDTKWTLE
jgi:hypothetical protein